MVWFIRKILRLDSGITVGQWIYDRLSNNWVLLASLIPGAAMTYAASITNWIKPWGALGWVGVGLATIIVVSLSIGFLVLLISAAFSRRALAKYSSSVMERSGVDVLSDTFFKKRITLGDFFHPYLKPTRYAKFTECEIFGPSALVIQTACTLEAPRYVDCEFVILNEPVNLSCAIIFEHCTFERCAFYKVLIGVTKQQIDHMRSLPGVGIPQIIAGIAN